LAINTEASLSHDYFPDPFAMNKRTHLLKRKQVFFASILLVGLSLSSRAALAAQSPPGYTDRSAEYGCKLYRKNEKTITFKKVDLLKPFSPENTIEGLMKRSSVGDDGGDIFNEDQCKAYLAGSAEYAEPEFANGHLRYRRTDVIHEDDLEPVYKWETRYLYVNEYGADLTPIEETTEKMRRQWAVEAEIKAYQADTIREGTRQLFTPDGRYFNQETGTIWKMYLSPMGDIVMKDTTNKYLPIGAPGYWPGLSPVCHRDAEHRAICGYIAITGLGKPNENPPITEGRLSIDEKESPAMRIGKDKVTLLQRLGTLAGAKSLSNETFNFFANFDDPIRPVVFAPGVLFKKGVKAKLDDKFPASSFVDQEVCVADCPDQLKLQEQWINAK
jgi:hypothetical protein